VFSTPQGPPSDNGYQVTRLVVSKGATVVSVYVVVMSEPRSLGGASGLARRLAAECIGRLG
jgi:hypothetical protein